MSLSPIAHLNAFQIAEALRAAYRGGLTSEEVSAVLFEESSQSKFPALLHGNGRYWFRFFYHDAYTLARWGVSNDGHAVVFTPGEETRVEEKDGLEWAAVLGYVERWARTVQKEQASEAGLWVDGDLSVIDELPDEPFTEEERQSLEDRLEIFQATILAHLSQASEEQKEEVRLGIADLKAALPKETKKKWFIRFFAWLRDMVTGAVLGSDKAQEVLGQIPHLVHRLLGGG